MDLDVIFLGTAGAVPTARRAPSATLVRRGGERLLVDCGEGTQRQLLRSAAGLCDVDRVLLTHFHADHVLGLPGMLKTFALRTREAPLEISGPVGLNGMMRDFARVIGRLTYEVRLQELEPGAAVQGDGYRIEAFSTDHRGTSIGYALCEALRPGRFDLEAARSLGVPDGPAFGALQRGEAVSTPAGDTVAPDQVLGPPRPGRRIVFTGDTRPAAVTLEASAAADLLVHEATFLTEDAARAVETGHSTAAEASALARDAQVAMLALTHLSTRYTGRQVRDEARTVFPDAVVPRDLDLIALPLPERGRPELVRDGGAAGAEPVAGPGVSCFDEAAAGYDRLRPAGAQWHAVSERTLERLGGATRLLDVGCGTGRFAVLAAERLGARVWGVDASEGMLDQARAREGAAAVGWRRAEAGRLPFRAGWFDAAHMHLVAHLIEDRGAAWAELARVLAPGGRFVLVTFEPESFRDHYLIRWFPSVAPIDEARFPTVAELGDGLAAAGFGNVAFEPFAQRWTMRAADVLERVRGRYISTLRLVSDDEFAAGVGAAERDLADGREVEADLRWLLVTARAGR